MRVFFFFIRYDFFGNTVEYPYEDKHEYSKFN